MELILNECFFTLRETTKGLYIPHFSIALVITPPPLQSKPGRGRSFAHEAARPLRVSGKGQAGRLNTEGKIVLGCRQNSGTSFDPLSGETVQAGRFSTEPRTGAAVPYGECTARAARRPCAPEISAGARLKSQGRGSGSRPPRPALCERVFER